jgi:hypothetical protein
MAAGIPGVGAVESVTGAQSSPFGSAQVGDVAAFLGQISGTGGASKAAKTMEAGRQGVYDMILGPLNEFRAGYDRILEDITELVGRGSISMQDLIHVQFQLTQIAYMNDLSSKTADKISQGVQTWFRNQ